MDIIMILHATMNPLPSNMAEFLRTGSKATLVSTIGMAEWCAACIKEVCANPYTYMLNTGGKDVLTATKSRTTGA